MIKILKIVAALGCLMVFIGAGLMGGCGYLIYSSTVPLADETNKTLKLISEGKTHEAYQEMSTEYRSGHDEEAFAAESKELHLETWKESTWSSRNISSPNGSVAGTMKLGDQEVSMKVSLHKDGEAWKVASIAHQ